jgi:lipopolysaccharide export system protein LptC
MKLLHLVFGHQGGWDEILLVVAPLCLIAWLLWAANRKAEKMNPEEKSDFAAENDSKNSDD